WIILRRRYKRLNGLSRDFFHWKPAEERNEPGLEPAAFARLNALFELAQHFLLPFCCELLECGLRPGPIIHAVNVVQSRLQRAHCELATWKFFSRTQDHLYPPALHADS